jgi:hypothetical protein
LADAAPGADTPEEQHLGEKQIAHPGQVSLVEQCLADLPVRVGPEPPHRLGRVPVGTEQVGAEVADDASLVLGRHDLDDAKQVSERLPLVVAEDEPDPVITRQVVTGRPDPPGPVHAQVGVDRLPAVHAGQQVLSPGNSPGHDLSGQVGRGEPWHPEVAALEHASGQCLVELACRAPDHIALGHEVSIAPAADGGSQAGSPSG